MNFLKFKTNILRRFIIVTTYKLVARKISGCAQALHTTLIREVAVYIKSAVHRTIQIGVLLFTNC